MHNLPDGTTTQDTDEYVKKWEEFFEGAEKILGGEVYAFNPHISLSLGVHTLQIRPHTAERLAKLWGILNRLINEAPTCCETSVEEIHKEDCPWGQLREFMKQ